MRQLPSTGKRGRPLAGAHRFRGWLATWLQDRRRKGHLSPAPVLRPMVGSLLAWDWALPNPAKWNVWVSLDNGATFMMPEDYWAYGNARQFAPDGGSQLHYIVGVDANGRPITQRSNSVKPDDAAPPPVNAPVIVGGGYEDGTTTPGWFDVFFDWTFDHGSYPTAEMEIWMSINGSPFSVYYVAPSNDPGWYYAQATNTPATFDFKVRYTDSNTGVIGPFSNVYQISITP